MTKAPVEQWRLLDLWTGLKCLDEHCLISCSFTLSTVLQGLSGPESGCRIDVRAVDCFVSTLHGLVTHR